LAVLCQTVAVKREHLSGVTNVVAKLVQLGVEMGIQYELGRLPRRRAGHALLLELSGFGCVVKLKYYVTGLKIFAAVVPRCILALIHPVV
jgi:hypothetical protein